MFIEFTFDPKLLFLIIFPIFKEIEKVFAGLYYKENNSFFKVFKIFLSKEFCFIFLLIFKCINKTNKKEIIRDEQEKNEENEIIEQPSGINLAIKEIDSVEKKNKIKSILFLFLLSILYFGAYCFNYLYRSIGIRLCRNSIGIIYQIIIIYILTFDFFKCKVKNR